MVRSLPTPMHACDQQGRYPQEAIIAGCEPLYGGARRRKHRPGLQELLSL
jgi:hypothetical protein